MSGFGTTWKENPEAPQNRTLTSKEFSNKYTTLPDLAGSIRDKQKDYRDCYDEESKALVEEKCKKELDLFEYDFNGMVGDRFIYTVYDENPINAWPLGKEEQEKRELAI